MHRFPRVDYHGNRVMWGGVVEGVLVSQSLHCVRIFVMTNLSTEVSSESGVKRIIWAQRKFWRI